jgi:hypothetical protein
MFNILTYKGNKNKNDSEIPSHPSQHGHHQEHKRASEDVAGVGEALIGGNANECSHYRNQYGSSSRN